MKQTKKPAKRYFVLAPREMSEARLRQLLRELLVRRPVTFGLAEEAYVAGFEGQPQFKTLSVDKINSLAEKSGGRITLLPYKQKDVVDVVKNLDFDRAIVVNGSHHRSFHLRPEYQAILDKGAMVKYVSPFTDTTEALMTACELTAIQKSDEERPREAADTQAVVKAALQREAARSFDTSFQNAAAVVRLDEIVCLAHNATMPYETYAWHHGLIREKEHCAAGEANHYDTVHAETAVLMEAGMAARGANLYCRTFPCPHCTKNIIFAGIGKVYYELDYGDEYGYNLLKEAGVEYERI
jgi:deoxycytidylate deaminase